jgi:hypothetical protein
LSISDASEQGGSAAEAVRFANCISADQGIAAQNLQMSILESGPPATNPFTKPRSFQRVVCKSKKPFVLKGFECVKGCGATSCGRPCWDYHSTVLCPFKKLTRPRAGIFGPSFSNELHWCVVAAGGVPEIVSFPSEGPSGVSLLMFILAESSWSGWLGKHKVRTDKHPLGVSDVPFSKHIVRADNKLGHQMVDAVSSHLQAGGHFLILHPARSFLWRFHDLVQLQHRVGVVLSSVSVHHNDGVTVWHLLHNISGASTFLPCTVFSPFPVYLWDLPPSFFKSLSLMVSASLGSLAKLQLPVGHQDQRSWVLDALRHSTKGLSKPGVALFAAEAVMSLIATMCPGNEIAHLQGLLNIIDFRGSDVRLDSGVILEGSRQPTPYPAICWDWAVVQSYGWQQHQHINVLELLAFFNYLRSVAIISKSHSQRILHVLDSRVCSCVLSKGRSSSKLLNRLLRRILGVSLAADLYVLPLWTVSAWNFSDAGSRTYSPEGIT